MANPGLLAVVDDVGMIDVKSLRNSERCFDVGDLTRADAVTLLVGKTKLMLPDVGTMSR